MSEHFRRIRATPTPGGDDRLLQVDQDVRISFDVVDPVTRTVSPWHPGDEQLVVVVVQEDLDATWLTGPSASRRQIDDLAVVQRCPGGVTQRVVRVHCAILSTEPTRPLYGEDRIERRQATKGTLSTALKAAQLPANRSAP